MEEHWIYKSRASLLNHKWKNSEWNNDGDNAPKSLSDLDVITRTVLLTWCDNIPVQNNCRVNHRQSSAQLIKIFKLESGLTVTNGQIKGAMLLAGHIPADAGHRNWCFKIKTLHSRTSKTF